MPTETILVIVPIVLGFITFAVALLGADLYSRDMRHTPPAE